MSRSRFVLLLTLVTALISSSFRPWNQAADTEQASETQVPAKPQFQSYAGDVTAASAPVLDALSPSQTLVSGEPLTVTFTGEGFQADAIAQWDGNPMPTINISETELTGDLPAEALQQAAILKISVANPIPGGGSELSNELDFTVGNPVPMLASIMPQEVAVGENNFNMYLEGDGFVDSSKIYWNDTELVTTFGSSNNLIAAVPSNLILNEGSANISVKNPVPGGGTSNSLPFTITPLGNVWVAHSPEGGPIVEIEVDPGNPSILYVGTHFSGIFKSLDAGNSWFPINNGLNLSYVYSSLAVDPANSSRVFASTIFGTYLSTNGGSSWSRVLARGAQSPNLIQFDPNNHNMVYVAASGVGDGPTTQASSPRVFRSSDGGKTWIDIVGTKLGTSISNEILHVAVDGTHSGTLYVLLKERALVNGNLVDLATTLWKTTNNGNSWSNIRGGLPAIFFSDLAIDPSNSSILYTVTGDNQDRSQTGIYRSVDSGTTWSRVVEESTNIFYDLLFHKTDPNHVYASTGTGMYISVDGGQTWNYKNANLQIPNLEVDPANPAMIYGGGFNGLHKSLDTGDSWSTINKGLYGQLITSLAYSSPSNELFALAFGGGYWKSSDYGKSWEHLSISEDTYLATLIVDPNDPEHMFSLNGGAPVGFIFETTEAWNTWAQRPFAYTTLAFASNSDLYAGTSDGSGNGPGGKIYKSIDGGNTWVEKSTGLPECASQCKVVFLVADPTDPNVLYANLNSFFLSSTSYTNVDYLVKTTDGGDTWSQIDNGIVTINNQLVSMTVDPLYPSILYLGTTNGVLKSADAGASWVKAGTLPLSMINALIVDPGNDQIVYAGTEGYGVYRSIDAGATWASFNYGMTPGRVRAMLPISTPVPAPSDSQMGIQSVSNTRLTRLFSVTGGMVYSYFVVNYPPTDISLSPGSIAGKLPIGTKVGAFSTSDPNTADAFSYSFATGDGDTDNGSFTISGNQLSTAEVFDHSLKNSYSIRMRSTDAGGAFVEKAFTIQVTANSKAPLLVAPANGQVLLHNRPMFDWDNVTGATSYTIQISKNSTFTSLLLTKIVKVSQYDVAKTLPPNLKLYWRARANFGSTAGSWSLARNLFTANPPGVPTLRLPANGSLITRYQPGLDWNTVSLPGGTFFDHYHIQIATEPSFQTLVLEHNATDRNISDYTPDTPLSSNTRFYWRVRSFNTSGHYSVWSPVWSFRAAPLPPVLLEPANDSLESIHTNVATFSWSDPNTTDVTSYTIQISKNSTFTSIIKTGNPTATSFTSVLPSKTLLFWRVQAKGPIGASAWSSPTWSLRTGNPPSAPILTAPLSGSLTSIDTPIFKWKPSTFPAGTTFLHYQIQVSADKALSSPVIDTTTPTTQHLSSISLDPNKTYYWRVRTFNTNNDFSKWSATWSLRTPIDSPLPVTPENDATTVDLRPTFSWDHASDPGTNYTIQVSTIDTFQTVLINASSAVTSFIPSTDLPVNTTLYWRVRAQGTNGTSAWSPTFSFTTANPPSTPSILSPDESSLIATINLNLGWTASLHTGGWYWGLDQYQVQIDNSSDFGSPEHDLMATSCTTEWSTGTPVLNCSLSLFQGDQLPADGLYYVRVRNISSEGTSSWSATRSFNLQLGYADCPLLIPDDGEAANYSISQSVTEGSPVVSSLRINPFLPAQSQFVTLTVNASVKPYSNGSQPLDPITSITIDVVTDHGTTAQVELSLVSGTDTNGTWQGQWTVSDSYCYRYGFFIHATNAISTTTTGALPRW